MQVAKVVTAYATTFVPVLALSVMLTLSGYVHARLGVVKKMTRTELCLMAAQSLTTVLVATGAVVDMIAAGFDRNHDGEMTLIVTFVMSNVIQLVVTFVLTRDRDLLWNAVLPGAVTIFIRSPEAQPWNFVYCIVVVVSIGHFASSFYHFYLSLLETYSEDKKERWYTFRKWLDNLALFDHAWCNFQYALCVLILSHRTKQGGLDGEVVAGTIILPIMYVRDPRFRLGHLNILDRGHVAPQDVTVGATVYFNRGDTSEALVSFVAPPVKLKDEAASSSEEPVRT